MDRTDETGESICTGCGRPVVGGLQRAYGFGDDQLLCWDCAVARGGSFDAGEDRWAVAPRVEDLLGD